MLTQANAKLAEGLLPPEILRHYATGEYLNTPIAAWPNGIFKFDPEFLAATENLYGRVELYIDKETYEGAWNRKFSWTGELLNTLPVMTFLRHKYTRPDGGSEYLIGSNMGYRVAENVKMNRATTAGTPAPLKEPASDTRIPIEPAFFEMSTRSRFGK